MIVKQDFHAIDMVLYRPSLKLTASKSDGFWSHFRKKSSYCIFVTDYVWESKKCGTHQSGKQREALYYSLH